ncbi:MAG: hypothetical protein M0P58_11225 [Bacteroidales bacterium]|nr:hypothetical protein [Bacteroidales bacterium]
MKELKKIFLVFWFASGFGIICIGQTDSLMTLLQHKHTPEKKVDLLNKLADFYIYRNLDSAMSFAQEALILAMNSHYQKGEILALINKSEIYREVGKYQKSMNYANQIKNYADKLTDKELLAKFYMLSGYVYMSQFKYNEAIDLYYKSLNLFREKKDLIGMGDVQRKMGQSFGGKGDYDLMYDYYLTSLNCYQQAGYKRGIAASINNLAGYFRLKKEYRKAITYFHQAIRINIEEGNYYWLSKNYFNMSMLMQEINQMDSSFYYSKVSYELAKKVGNPYWLALSLMQYGALFKLNHENQTALKYFYEALNLSVQIGSIDNLKLVSDSIGKTYYQMKRYDSAYVYLQKYYAYSDTININNDNTKYSELKYQIETERKLRQFALQNQKRFFIFLLIAVCLVLIIVILFLLYNRQKVKIRNAVLEKENLTDNIELKNKELANNILIAQKKNEVINKVIKHLEDNKIQLPEQSWMVVDQVIRNLSATIEEKGWEEFEMVFSQIHESFFIKLDQQFPDLTTKERRLCALLSLNMSSKEIAEIAQLLPRSVDTARHRLRKKLGIETVETDLVTFLRNL